MQEETAAENSAAFFEKSQNSDVIARAIGPWRSPGTMFVIAQQVDEWYQEIATSGIALLAMTVF